MSIIAAGQITVVDVSDSPVLNAFITANRPTTQLYSQTSGTYNPSYASTPQVLTLNLTRAASTTSIISGTSNVRWFYVDGGTKREITSKNNSDPQYVSGNKNEVLTTKINIDPSKGGARFEVSGMWRDPVTGMDVNFSTVIDLFLVQIGKEAQVLNVYAGGGNTFRNNTPSTLTVNADLYRGNLLTNDTKRFKFFYQDTSVIGNESAGYDSDGGIGWHLCSSSTVGQTPNVEPNVTTTTQGLLTVTPDVVVNSQTFKVVCINVGGAFNGSKSKGLCTLVDMSDPYSLVIESSAGNIFKNLRGSTTLKAKLYRNGEEIDVSGNGKIYKWSKFDEDGNMDVNFGSPGNAYKTGKSITVNATDVESKTSYKCEVWE